MVAPARELTVAPDRFEIVTQDIVLKAELSSAIAVCVHDAVEDAGALLHLRLIFRGPSPTDVTDTTLATELLLLDRCIEALRNAAPGARSLQAKVVVHLPDFAAIEACDAVLQVVSHFLRDAGAPAGSPDVAFGAPRRLQFRPGMGWLHVR